MLDKAIRDLDRERVGLQTQEKKLVAEIKKTAKQGQMVCNFTFSMCNPSKLMSCIRKLSTIHVEIEACVLSAGCC